MGITFLSDTGFPQADGCVKQREGDEALPMLNAEDRSIHTQLAKEGNRRMQPPGMGSPFLSDLSGSFLVSASDHSEC